MNFRNSSTTTDPYDFFNRNQNNEISISLISTKPKLIINGGFFYYQNGDIVLNKSFNTIHKRLLKQLTNYKLTFICELRSDKPSSLEKLYTNKEMDIDEAGIIIVDYLWELASKVNHQSTMSVITSLIKQHYGIGLTTMFTVKGISLINLMSILGLQIQNRSNISKFILRTETSKDSFLTDEFESIDYLPTLTIKDKKIVKAFMLNGNYLK